VTKENRSISGISHRPQHSANWRIISQTDLLLEYRVRKRHLNVPVFSISNLILQQSSHLRLSGSETDGAFAKIIDGVPFSEESVTENGEWSYGLGEVLKIKR
jgi:hypothetical protein